MFSYIYFDLCYTNSKHKGELFTELNAVIPLCLLGFFSIALSYFYNTETCTSRPNYSCCGVFSCTYQKQIDYFPQLTFQLWLSVILLTLLKISCSSTYLKFYYIFYSLRSRSCKYIELDEILSTESSSIILVP